MLRAGLLFVLCSLACGADAAPAARIVSLAPNLTQMVVALGAEGSLAAVTPFCKVPGDVARLPGGIQPEAEAVLALAPDLVLSSSMTPATTRKQLVQLGLRVEVIDADSLDGIRTTQRKLAVLLGVTAPKIPEAAKPALGRSVALLFGADTGYSAGCGTHAHEILEAAGLRNIAAEAGGPWPQLGEELLLAADPEVMVVADYGQADRESVLQTLRAHPVRKHLSAVRGGRVLVFPAAAFSIPGPAALQAGATLRAEVDAL
jgi:iron complex transport system substrate-binding protein